MNEDQEEIIKYCYNKAINELKYNISLKDLLGLDVFSKKNIRIIIRELRNLEKNGKIILSGNFPIENKELIFIAIALKGLLFWESISQAINPIFTELTKKYLIFVHEVELGKRKLNEGEGAQFGSISLNKLSELLEEPSEERIIYVQQKADSIFTQKIGYSSNSGIIFYGENEPFLTMEGEDFLYKLERYEDESKNLEGTQELNELEIHRVDKGIIYCKLPGNDEYITLEHIANFNSILPDFYAEAGMQFNNDEQALYTNELYGEKIAVIAEDTGLYIEKKKVNRPEVQKLKRTLVINKERDEFYGKWKIIKLINRGGQGFIFEAKKEGVENNYALKSYRVSGNSPYQQQKIKRFQSEVTALEATTDCKNVIKLIDKDGIKKTKDYSDYYFVMELADQSLNQYIRKSQFKFNEIVRYFRQILDAFECIHKKGIIHRDIKPQNILIKDNTIKVSDFGINYRNADDRLTQINEIVGSRFFICPESEDGRLKKPDIKCDIYSLGKLLYYLLSNGICFAREKYEKEEYNLINIHNDYRFTAFLPFFRKTMIEDKNERYSNVSELKKGFEKSIESFHKIPIFVELYFSEQLLLEQCPKFILDDKYNFYHWVILYFLIKIELANFDLPYFMESQIQDGYRYGTSCVFFNVTDLQSFESKLNKLDVYCEVNHYEGDISFYSEIIELIDAKKYTEKINKLINEFSLFNDGRFHDYLYNKEKFYTLLDAYIDIL